jgi:hypothetical protein
MRPDRLTDGEREVLAEIERDARDIGEAPIEHEWIEPENASQVVYGFYHGGDPREFHPDYECCSEKEIADHKAACALWNEMLAKGLTPTPEACESGWRTLPDGTRYHVLKSRYGIGTYTI